MLLTDSFDWQWRISGTCALHALRHALLCIGIPTTSAEVEEAMGIGYWQRWRGNSEDPILRALPRFDLDAHIIDTTSPTQFGALLDAEIAAGRSAILCINDEDHWMAIAGKTGDRYLWIDSNERSLFGTCTLTSLSQWAGYESAKQTRSHWALVPRQASATRMTTMVPRFNEARRAMMNDEVLRRDWAIYLELVRSLDREAHKGARRLWSYLDGEPARLVAETTKDDTEQRSIAQELRRISWVSYCHDTRMPNARACIPALQVFLKTG